jgi:transcriptional antiterminator RfaH
LKAWYCAYTQPRMEMWARSNLWERGFEVYLPLYRRRRSHARRVDWVSAPLFPRYLFVQADLEAGERRGVASARGVERLVAFGDRPASVAPEILAELRAREDGSGHIELRPNFAAGEALRVLEGALLDQVGLFQGLDDERRVVLLLTLLNRQVSVRLPAHAVAREG